MLLHIYRPTFRVCFCLQAFVEIYWGIVCQHFATMAPKRQAVSPATPAPLLADAVASAAAPTEAAAPAPPLEPAMLDTGHRRKQQYPGTWSHTDRTDIKAPKELPKPDFGTLLMRLMDTIFRAGPADGTRRSRQNRVQRISIFQELHESGEIHYHFNILAELP